MADGVQLLHHRRLEHPRGLSGPLPAVPSAECLAGQQRAKIYSSYAFVEGWAHYTELMMIEEGFVMPPADPVRSAKYRLAQSGESLLRLCRLCCSVQMHTEKMSLDEATEFFEKNCY